MFADIALRNVKRQIGNYLVYFTTVALTIALMFAFCNLIFSETLQKNASKNSDLAGALIGITVFVCLVTAFVLSYAAVYMLGLRRKEFGTYLTLGMKRRDILKLFALETLIISAFAAAVGIAAGLFVWQGLSALLCRLLDTDVSFAAYSPRGLALTLILTAAMFAVSLLVSARYLYKVSINELLSGEKHERKTKHVILWGITAALSFAGIIGGFYAEYKSVIRSILYDDGTAILLPLGVLCACIFIFHTAFSRAIGGLLLGNKTLCAKGTNTFVFRQLSSKMSVNSVMFGILGLLLTLTVIGTNMTFTEKITKEYTLDSETPFDVSAHFNVNDEHGVTLERGEKIIEKYSPIASKTIYELYTTDRNEISRILPGNTDSYTDSYMPLSQFNALLEKTGYEKLKLTDGYFIVSPITSIQDACSVAGNIELNGKMYICRGSNSSYPLFIYSLLYIVVPDEALQGMTLETECAAYELVNRHYDAYALDNELKWYDENGNDYCDFALREYARLTSDAEVGVLIVGTMYIAVVLICMALAILSMKTLSCVQEDKKRFLTLYRLGASAKERKRALYKMIFFWFAVPFIIPFSLCIPTGAVLGRLFGVIGMQSLGTDMLLSSVGIAAVMLAVYTLYFLVTCRISRSNIIGRADYSGISSLTA